jgi:hypothetical protein
MEKSGILAKVIRQETLMSSSGIEVSLLGLELALRNIERAYDRSGSICDDPTTSAARQLDLKNRASSHDAHVQ